MAKLQKRVMNNPRTGRTLRTLVKRAKAGEHPYAIYEVWGALLEDLPQQKLSKKPKECMQALVRQAIRTPFQGRDATRALAKKRSFLAGPLFSSAAQIKVMGLWEDEAQHPDAKGFGRFTRFHRSWQVLYKSRKATHKFIELLQRVHDPATSSVAAIKVARKFAARTDIPMRGTPRFSEALHLSRPRVFPLVNTKNISALEWIFELPPGGLGDRRAYCKYLKQMRNLCNRLGLKNDYNAFDIFLQKLGRQSAPVGGQSAAMNDLRKLLA